MPKEVGEWAVNSSAVLKMRVVWEVTFDAHEVFLQAALAAEDEQTISMARTGELQSLSTLQLEALLEQDWEKDARHAVGLKWDPDAIEDRTTGDGDERRRLSDGAA